MSVDNWRPEIEAVDFFGNQKKRGEVESRRPVIRRPSDLVGPGIAADAVRVTNWNDPLALFDGYYASLAGASNSPNLVENFVGHTVQDASLGGFQTLTSLSGKRYSRAFRRAAADPTTIGFDAWVREGPQEIYPAGTPFLAGSPPPEGTPVITRSGTVVLSGGNTFFYFAGNGFPNGLVTLMVCLGDATGCHAVVAYDHHINYSWVAPLQFGSGGAQTFNGGYRVDYIAKGW